MTPAARLQAAIEVLDEVIASARDDGHPRGRRAGERQQLAALVLHLDEAFGKDGTVVNAAVGRKPQAPGADAGLLRLGKLRKQRIARRAGNIYAQVERCALQQRRPFFRAYEWR